MERNAFRADFQQKQIADKTMSVARGARLAVCQAVMPVGSTTKAWHADA